MHHHFRLNHQVGHGTYALPYEVTFQKLIDYHNRYLPDKFILRS